MGGGGGVVGSMPLEKQKVEIVDTLHKMNENMKSYTMDVELRLEKALKAAGGKDVSKKYGFEYMAAKNVDEFMADDRMEREYKDTQAFNRKLIKMQAAAGNYLSKAKESDTTSTHSLPKIESSRVMPKVMGRMPALPDKI